MFRFVPRVSGLLVLLVVLFAQAGLESSAKNITTCADFEYQQDAQSFYDSGGGRPQGWYGGMDQNNDGRACEHLPSKPLHLKTGFQVAAGGGAGLLAIGGLVWLKRRNERVATGSGGNPGAQVPPQTDVAAAPQPQLVSNVNQQVDSSSKSESTSRSVSTATSSATSTSCPLIDSFVPYSERTWEGYRLGGFIDKEVLNRMPYKVYMQTAYWQKVSSNAKRDAGYQCRFEGCKRKDGYLEVHHLRYDQAYEKPEDLMVVCREHHLVLHDRVVPSHLASNK